jgi:hypothetical protein
VWAKQGKKLTAAQKKEAADAKVYT